MGIIRNKTSKTKQNKTSTRMVAKVTKKNSAGSKKAPAKTAKPIAKASRSRSTSLKKQDLKQSVKKEPVKPKTAAQKPKQGAKILDLCLVLDCTASMGSWIQRSKDTLKTIIENVKSGNPTLTVRASFVGYRDITDHNRFNIIDFTEDLDAVKNFISKMQADGGADFPEDVQGGFNKVFGLNWSKDSVKTCFHIADAPGHGEDICECGDSYPKGSPDGYKLQDQMREFAKRKITFTFVKVNTSCELMIKVMKENYNVSGTDMNVSDLAQAVATKTAAEVTKDFVNATSFILSTALGGGSSTKGKGKSKTIKKVKRTGSPLWNPKKIAEGQFFSQTAYLNVTKIEA